MKQYFKFMFVGFSIIVGLPVMLFIDCAEKPTQPDKTPVEIQIVAPSAFIFSGGTLQLSVLANFVDETTDDVTSQATWSNTPGTAGTIHQNGIFVAADEGVGIETIRADFQGQAATKQLEVTKRAISLAIWPAAISVESGTEVQFEAVAEFQDASKEMINEKVHWTLSPGQAGVIDANGCFRASQGKTGIEMVTGSFQTLITECRVQIQETSDIPFEMVSVSPGTFIMGDDSSYANEKPAHEVYTDGFEIGRYEVTNQQYVNYLNEAFPEGEIMVNNTIVTGKKGPFCWMEYMRLAGTTAFPDRFIEYREVEALNYEFRALPGFEDHPVVRLTWYGAAAFCRYYGLRLPTEAEWERACRGGRQLEYGTDDGSIDRENANFAVFGSEDNSYGFVPVGSFPPNPYGLYDMSGNAAEYVSDLYDAEYYSNSPYENPSNPGSMQLLELSPTEYVVWRGGAGLISAKFCRSAFRGYIQRLQNTSLPSYAFVGFRVARAR